MKFSDLNDLAEGRYCGASNDQKVIYLSLDSRRNCPGAGAVFFCLKGVHHDGHEYISDAYEKGWRLFVVETPVSLANFAEASFFVTASPLEVLQKLAGYHRSQFSFPVVGITGSNGKTIVKEWLYQLTASHFSVVKSPKSYNSQVGVPLSVWAMEAVHSLGIFEAGISQPGEMEKLERIIKPDIGIFTNIGSAHDEAFGSVEEKLLEKFKLFSHCRKLIYCADQPWAHTMRWQELLPGVVPVSWGAREADYVIVPDEGVLKVTCRFGAFEVGVPFQDTISVENLSHCIVAALELGVPFATIVSSIQLFRKIPMRMTLLAGIGESILIDDSYNNDLQGIRAAIDFLKAHAHGKAMMVILSDILQSGMDKNELYGKVREMLRQAGVRRLIGIGPDISMCSGLFGDAAEFYPDTAAFLQQRRASDFSGEAILIKGARVFGFEEIVRRFQAKVHRTVLEINLEALQHNFQFYRSQLAPGVKTMVMLKALAYGSGSGEIGRTLQYLNADYIAVAFPDEGVDLREQGVEIPMMVLNAPAESFDLLGEHRLEPEIFSFSQLQELKEWVGKRNKHLSIHLKLDTGMHRLGFVAAEWKKLAHTVSGIRGIRVASVFSHLAASEDHESDYFTLQQIQEYLKAYEEISQELGYKPLRHIVNTAGISRFPDYHLDMVRIGIGLHGIESSLAEKGRLRQVATLKTVVSQVKSLMPGDTVGYSRAGKLNKPSRIATLAIGYADGFGRAFGNGRANVLIGEKLYPTIGNICMDMTMVDVGSDTVAEGDEAIIFGPGLPVSQLAAWGQTIPYEILTSVSGRVKRTYLSE